VNAFLKFSNRLGAFGGSFLVLWSSLLPCNRFQGGSSERVSVDCPET